MSFISNPTSPTFFKALELKRCLLQGFDSFKHLKHVHARILRLHLNEDNYLINMILRCCLNFRNIDYTKLVFERTKHPNIYIWNTMIHGMVYNAMKLFMEVNPQLFDDCSHDYAEQQNQVRDKQQARKSRWGKLEELAKVNNQNGRIPMPGLATTTGQGTKVPPVKVEAGAETTTTTPGAGDELSQERRGLEALRLEEQKKETTAASVS